MSLGDGSADIKFMLSDAGVPVTFTKNGIIYTTSGIADYGDDTMMSGESASFVGKTISVLLDTSKTPGLVEGSQLHVNGVQYTAVSVLQQEDGALWRVVCAR